MDTTKVEVMFNATKYSKIKHYVREKPLTLTSQALLRQKTKTQKIFGML